MDLMRAFGDLLSDKSLLRDQAKLRRKEAAKARPDAGKHAAALFMRHIDPSSEDVIALYVATDSEMDTWPLAEALLEAGHSICLPVVTGRGKPLVFRRYQDGMNLEKGAFGISVPPETAPAVEPDIVVTPLLAFSRTGTRLGMGGGFYDRTLMELRSGKPVRAVGFAYALQEMPRLPAEKHDAPLDAIITEREAIFCQSATTKTETFFSEITQ